MAVYEHSSENGKRELKVLCQVEPRCMGVVAVYEEFGMEWNGICYFSSHCQEFLGAFEKLWKATMSFVMSCQHVCLSPHGATRLPLDVFS